MIDNTLLIPKSIEKSNPLKRYKTAPFENAGFSFIVSISVKEGYE